MARDGARTGGPIPKFNEYHVWKALETLSESVPLGRKKLSQILGIGEGSTRTILFQLQDEGIITVGKSGIVLTEHGVYFRTMYHMDVARVVASELTIGEKDCAVRVPRKAREVRFGCEERDAAIKSGATGATTLVFTNGKLVFPGSDYPVMPEVADRVRSLFALRNDDVVIIGTGPTMEAAEIGAVTAGLTILGGLQFNRDLKDILKPKSTSDDILSLAFAIHDLVGGLPVCAKSRDSLGIRIEAGAVIDNAYTGEVLEAAIEQGTTIRKVALSGPYKGIRVIVTPIELDGRMVAAVGVVDIRSMAGIDNLIRLSSEDDERGVQGLRRGGRVQDEDGGHSQGRRRHGGVRGEERLPERAQDEARPGLPLHRGGGAVHRVGGLQAGVRGDTAHRLPGAVRGREGDGGGLRPLPEKGSQHTLPRGRGAGRRGPTGPRAYAGNYIQPPSIENRMADIDAPGDAPLEIVRSLRGVVHAFYLSREVLEAVREEESKVRALGNIAVDNVGYSEALRRERVICIVKDPRFRPPAEPTVILVSGDGNVLGVEVFPFTADRFLPKKDVVWLSDGFVLFPTIPANGGEQFVMPPVTFPELNPGNGCKDVISCSPAPTCDLLIRTSYGLEDDPKLASVLVAFNPVAPGETPPDIDPAIAEYIAKEAESEAKVS